MTATDDLLKRLDAALDEEDIVKAGSLVKAIKEEVEKLEGQAAWRLLRRKGPSVIMTDSYGDWSLPEPRWPNRGE